jgi:hypothetical protein
MDEITVNLHMHTRYSDGHGSHKDIAEAALNTDVDVVIVTDHNVWVNGPEHVYKNNTRRVMLLVGEEIHDAARQPQKNHLLVFGAEKELAHLAADPQNLINGVRDAGGICFLAHPYDEENTIFNEPEIAWEEWQVQGYTGVELWNGLSEFKSLLKSRLHAAFYALNPFRVPHGPPLKMLDKWDELLNTGKRVVAVGGSDAHQLPGKMGPIKRTIFPYEIHFRSVNNHILLSEPLQWEIDEDKEKIYAAIKAGHTYLGNDLPAPTKGFRFSGQSEDGDFLMGDEVRLGSGVTAQIKLPQRAECILLKNGTPLKTWHDREAMVVNINEPGVYRIEVYIQHLGKRRGWIFSNPIYLR